MLCDGTSANSRTCALLIDSTNASNVSHCLSVTARNLWMENYEEGNEKKTQTNVTKQTVVVTELKNRTETRTVCTREEEKKQIKIQKSRFKLRCINSKIGMWLKERREIIYVQQVTKLKTFRCVR